MGRVSAALGLLFSGLAGCSAAVERYVDPLSVTPPSAPNWALAAAQGVETVGAPTQEAPVFQVGAARLLQAFDVVATSEARVVRAQPAGEPALGATYVQRSRVFRFPDVVSARALDLGDGRASLAVYSAAVYGRSDFGVNAARITRWLSALEARMAAEGVARLSSTDARTPR